MSEERTLSNKLVRKLALSFLCIIVLVGTTYILITAYFADKYFEETTQRLNAQIANHIIQEKFQNASPFLEDGSVNKPLFGDLMHDMMAVNHGIEVYLLDEQGFVLYSVVLEHNANDCDRAVLTVHIGFGAFLNCRSNFLHSFGTGGLFENPAGRDPTVDDCQYGGA